MTTAESMTNPEHTVFQGQGGSNEGSPETNMTMSTGVVEDLEQPGNVITWAWDATSFSNAMNNTDSYLQW